MKSNGLARRDFSERLASILPVFGVAFGAPFESGGRRRASRFVGAERLVQAWREISWPPGVYSIVKFELTEKGAGTKLVFDHTGFPDGAAQHLAIGWKANYWEPLKKFLA